MTRTYLFKLLMCVCMCVCVCIVTRVRRRGENIHSQNCIIYLSVKYGETRNSCLLLVGKWNGSRHLIF
jgi:hypothetical protein